MEIVEPSEFDFGESMDTMSSVYRDYRDGEGIPVHTRFHVEDVNELETGYWERTDAKGAFVNNYGMEGIADLHVHELDPEDETTWQRHLFDQIVYVSKGRGHTAVGRGDDGVTFEWETPSCYYIPRNTSYKFVNESGEDAARLVCHTCLPQLLEMVRDVDFIFDCEYDFWDGDRDYYDPEPTIHRRTGRDEGHLSSVFWEANYVPDLREFDYMESSEANVWGAGSFAMFPFGDSSLSAHIAEFPTGMYKKAHHHAPGYNIIILSGEGYELMWPPGSEKIVRVDYGPHAILSPPSGWWHHHFHTAPDATSQLAMHPPELGTLLSRKGAFNPQAKFNTLEYVDEDPVIRNRYREELERRGLEFQMPEQVYTDPEFDIEKYLEEASASGPA